MGSAVNSYGHKRRIHLHRQPRTTKKRGLVEYYSLATCFYEDGKNQKKIIHGIGELTKEQAEHYRLFLRAINGQMDADNLVDFESLIFGDEKQYLDGLAMNAIWHKLDLNKIFSSDLSTGQRISTEHVARILTINRLLSPSSKVRTVDWLGGTMLAKIMGIDQKDYGRNKVFRELTNIHDSKDKIEQLFWKYSQKLNGKHSVYYFDGSTSWFEGSKCPLAEADLEKTRSFFPKVLGLMLVTDNKGFPVAWEVVNGHAKDTTELKNFVDRISQKFGITEITYCFDRGVASEKNFRLISDSKSKYISAIRDNQIKNVFDLEKFRATRIKITDKLCKNSGELTPDSKPRRRIVGFDGFYTSDNNIFFKDLGVINKKRYIASFNYSLFIKQYNERQKRIEQALLEIADKNADLETAKRDRDYNATERNFLDILAKYHVRKYFQYSLNPLTTESKKQSFKIECQLSDEKIQRDQLTDGILVFVSDHTEQNKESKNYIVSASDIISHYKGKHVVENAFREMKSFIELRPIFVWTEEHVKAHYDISIIACFINNFINEKIKDLDESLRDFHTHLEKAGRAVEILTPSGKKIFKLKKVCSQTKTYFSKLGLTKILSPSLHRSHSVSQ